MNEKYMRLALKEAKKAYKRGETPIGAVIVYNDEVIAKAYNLRESKQSVLAHAETLVIEKACKKLGSWRLEDCDIYITLEPCVMCCGAISHARIRRLYFGAYDGLAGGVVSAMHCFNPPSPLRSIEYYCGIMEEECSELLSDFFKNLRNCITSD